MIIDFLLDILKIVIGGLILTIILKHHKPMMDFIGKVVRFSYVYVVPLMFMIAIYLDSRFSLQEKHLLALSFCGLGIVFGTIFKWAEK